MNNTYARRLDAVMAGHRGDDAGAEQLLADEDPSVRAAALGALARCKALTAAHVLTALRDPATQVRWRAVELAPPDIPLVHLLADEDPSIVEAAATALGERDWDATPVSELCQVATGHDDPLCRESAIAALGAIAAGLDNDDEGEPRHHPARAAALEVLLAAMDDRPQVRRRALLGLHQFADESAEAAVAAALEDNDRQVRAVAGELLGVPVR
ncbi:hypothetical protein [Candidatus Poriferisodalis sp.]|uniref:hypothetical protein n=1 Tax=Candidatus Poriferisodalis sp. TaxID=3101277 RepID=UPI003D113575